jgi:hypothetical protein
MQADKFAQGSNMGSGSEKSELIESAKTAFSGMNVLRWHYGMIGQPKSSQCPAIEPFESAFGLALGTTDPGAFECLCPVLIFNRWDPGRLLEATAQSLRGRLRLAAGIGLFFTDFSRLEMPFPLETAAALLILQATAQQYSMENDPWNDPAGKDEPEGLYLEFFRPYGLYVNWPLADFWKQYKWAAIRNEERVSRFLEEAMASQSS